MPKRNAQLNSQLQHFAAPTGGWNSLDNIAAMAATDAVQLDNLFPEPTYVRARRGSVLYANLSSVMNVPVQTLMTYSTASAAGAVYQQLFACASNGTAGIIFDISVENQPGGVHNFNGSGYFEWVNFSTPGGQNLVCVNGNGQQTIYNGTIWAAGSNQWDSGIPQANFTMIASFQQRLFFAGDTSLYLYYLPTTVFQGEISGFDCGQFFQKGGQIACLGTWTRDNAFEGMNDLLIIVSTMGEMLAYFGDNPSDPNNWSLIGRYEMGMPVSGHRQLCRLGPDMMLICEDGFQSLANYLFLGQSKALQSSISLKIGNAVAQAVKTNRMSPGWQAILYPANNAIIVNVPTATGYQQYVVNTISGAWCRFLGLNAYCWGLFNNNIYFGSSGGQVMQADTGQNDNGTPINIEMVTAFQVLGGDPLQKRATMARPYLIAQGQINPVMDVNVDYSVTPVASPVVMTSSGAMWDQFRWDQANWADSGSVQTNWFSVQGVGTAFAIHLKAAAQAVEILQLMAFDVAYEPGVGFL